MLAAATALATLGQASTSDWSVKQLQFSALSIGVYFSDAKTGWSSFTDGASAIKLSKTTDGGATWANVANQTNSVMIMGLDGANEPLDVVSTGMLGTEYSTDGDAFKGSKGGPLVSQSIKSYSDGRVIVADENAVYLSADGGKTYSKKAVTPSILVTPGRYAAAPSANVMYLTAGQWPSSSNKTEAETTLKLTSELSIKKRTFANGGSRFALELGASQYAAPNPAPPTGYGADIYKTADGGKTWTSVFHDAGNFYFNGIDCFDEKTCIAVGEGFGHDGSKAPGSRIYGTTDGTTWTLLKSDAVDGSSLMAAKMLSATSHVAGGRLSAGLSYHSTDGGKTYVMKGSKVKGQMITDLSFITDTHAFATAVNNLQICSLLEYA